TGVPNSRGALCRPAGRAPSRAEGEVPPNPSSRAPESSPQPTHNSRPPKARSNPSRVYCECPSVEGPPYSCFRRPAPLLPFPERTKRAILAVGEVLALLVRAAHVALDHCHGFDAVLEEEVLQLLLHLRVGRHVRGHPPLDDCLGTVMQDDPCGDLGRDLVVGAV